MFTIGTLYNYTRNLYFKQKWNLKKQGIDVDTNNNSTINYVKEMKKVNKTQKINSIRSKLISGKKLSAEEMEFLRLNAPDLHEKANEISKERAEYQRELKKCKTKDDVVRTNTGRICQLTSQATSSAGTSSNASSMEFIQMKIAAIQDEHHSFSKSTQFSKLKWNREMERSRQEDRNLIKKSVEKTMLNSLDRNSEPSNVKEGIDKYDKAIIESKVEALVDKLPKHESPQIQTDVSNNSNTIDDKRRRKKFSARV